MARAAVAVGVRAIVATPHVNFDYDFDVSQVGQRVGELNLALAREEIPLAVLPGGELAMSRLAEMTDEALDNVRIADGPYLLVESPYSSTPVLIDELLFGLQLRGFRPILAHPERSPLFHRDIDRLRALVQRGVLCSVNAGSMAGVFGSTVRRFALQLFSERLVHDVASDAHDLVKRPPNPAAGFDSAERELPGIAAQMQWFTETAPAAIVAGQAIPPQPDPPKLRRRRLPRLLRSS